jgi:hypothetical protein
MFASLRQFISRTSGSLPAQAPLPAVPLRRTKLPLEMLRVGNSVLFSEACPLPQLRARTCLVRGLRTCRFGQELVKNYQLLVEGSERFSLAIAEDADGHYLAISRQLDASEQDAWFGRDALGFFMEPSTAKTIRCKIDRVIEAGWAAERYSKIVDWVPGALVATGKAENAFHYNLLVNETGEKALEIEHYDALNHSNVFITVYRPVEDILSISEATPELLNEQRKLSLAPKPQAPAPVQAHQQDQTQLEAEPTRMQAPSRPDFRRVSDTAIHIPATSESVPLFKPADEAEVPLPKFLMSRENEQYISLDDVLAPEPERVRCSVRAAKALIDVSLERNVRVCDVLRDLLGLESSLSEEVIFELPLSERDYRVLAQRYKIRADHRDEIRARLQEDLRKKLFS